MGTANTVSQVVADEMSTDSKADEQDAILASKNLFARTATTVFSMRNRAHGAVKESELTTADEMESYAGDEDSPRNFEEQVDKADGSCSRDEWAAARDDIDFIINDTANLVSKARLRAVGQGHENVLDPPKTLKERQDAMVMMKVYFLAEKRLAHSRRCASPVREEHLVPRNRGKK
jgi:hypothetical protein